MKSWARNESRKVTTSGVAAGPRAESDVGTTVSHSGGRATLQAANNSGSVMSAS